VGHLVSFLGVIVIIPFGLFGRMCLNFEFLGFQTPVFHPTVAKGPKTFHVTTRALKSLTAPGL
jgi:hypothetical protein